MEEVKTVTVSMSFFQKLFKGILLIVSTWFFSNQAAAQGASIGQPWHSDLAISTNIEEWNGSIALYRTHTVIKKVPALRVGYGLRLNGYRSNSGDYLTAPAELTSGQTGLGVIFTENIEENFDTFTVNDPTHFSLNAAIYLEAVINPKWRVGFNIDAIGFSFGPEAEGVVTSNGVEQPYSAKPTVFNALLTSDNDLGMLNSELYATYDVNDRWFAKAGLTFLFTEYTTTTEVPTNFNNDRFRRKSLMGMISFGYSL